MKLDKFKLYLNSVKRESANGTEYDVNYQTIELPGLTIDGYQNKSYEDNTWNVIKKLVDYKDKTVADIGCLNGLYSFKVKELGAKKVVGYDLFQQACDTATEIAKFKKVDVEFKQIDISRSSMKDKYDIVLFLNVLHHSPDTIHTLHEIFDASNKHVIMEVQFTGFGPEHQTGWERLKNNIGLVDREKVKDIGKLDGFKLEKRIKSIRPFREFLLFTK